MSRHTHHRNRFAAVPLGRSRDRDGITWAVLDQHTDDLVETGPQDNLRTWRTGDEQEARDHAQGLTGDARDRGEPWTVAVPCSTGCPQ